MKPEIVRTIAELRRAVAGWRREGLRVGMVPTMGALHEGHLALVRAGAAPRTTASSSRSSSTRRNSPRPRISAPIRATRRATGRSLPTLGPDLLFAPAAAEMYPPGFDTKVVVGGPAAGLETDFRPHFFAGVATVVAKLLLAGLPDRAFFGEKDFQQLLVVKQLVRDLNIPTEIVGCPTIARAGRPRPLLTQRVSRAPTSGPARRGCTRSCARRRRCCEPGCPATMRSPTGRRALEAVGFAVDYLELRNAETLAPVQDRRASRPPARRRRLGKTG